MGVSRYSVSACERAGPRPFQIACVGASQSSSSQCTWKLTPRRHSVWSISPSDALLSLRWIVTHSPNRCGSMITSQTFSGGASIVIDVMTSLMRAATLSRGQLLQRLPVAQRSLDRGVEPMQPHAEQRGGAVVAWEQITVEAFHERPDELD